MPDWGTLAATAGFLLTAALTLYGFAKTNGKQEAHSANMNRRLDQQDNTLHGLRTAIQGTREDVAKIKGKIGMNGS